jgi:3-oxoacyl-[acyl-carrier-protein] synthase-3
MPYAHIVGWGKYLPGKPITNPELAARAGIELDDEWLRTRTGIRARYFGDEKESTSTLSIRAARQALQMADLDADQLDLIIVGTNSPDNLFPATACRVQDALGASRAGAFDLSAGCPGFLYGLVVGSQFIRSGAMKHVLVIGAECISKLVNLKDKSTCAFFGDGAGAVVLTARDDPGGLLGFSLGSDGSGADLLVLPAGGSRLPLSQRVLDEGLNFGRMDGAALYRFGSKALAQAVTDALRNAGVSLADIDLFVPHQSNARLIQQVAATLKIPDEKVLVNIDRYANTSAAALPLGLCDAVEAGRLKPGDHVVLGTYGAGLTWGGAVIQWAVPTPVKPLPRWRRILHGARSLGGRQRTLWRRVQHWLDRRRGRPSGG